MMKNILIILILSLAISFVATSFYPATQRHPDTAEDQTYNHILKTGIIRCGYINWWPAVMKDTQTGQMKGYVVDYFNELAKSLDLKIEWAEEINLGTYLTDLNNRRYDLECAGGWPSAARGKLIAYTDPFAYSPLVPFVRADDTRFDSSIATLKQPDLKAAVVDGDTGQIVRRAKFPNMKEVSIPQLSSISEYFMMVATGKADVTFSDYVGGLQYMEQNPGKLKALPYKLRLVPQCIGVPMGETKLLSMLNTANRQLILDGTVNTILDKYEPEQKIFVRTMNALADDNQAAQK
ncbi:MAG: substrate-binding periplasmic protein [Bdellovibrionales bacterium]